MKQVLKSGVAVGGSGSFKTDVPIDGEKVTAVGTGEEIGRPADKDTRAVGVKGCLLFPGFIDAHTHFDPHTAGTVMADNFATGTKVVVRGGTTTIVDLGTQYTGESLANGPRNWHEKADGRCSCDYGFHMSTSDWNPPVSGELDDIMEEGITSFKLYMTHDIQMDDKAIFEILRRPRGVGGIIGVHCENSDMIAAPQAEAKAVGRMSMESHPATWPAAVGAEAIDRPLRLAEMADIPVIVVHPTCREGYDVIMEARRRGQKVYAETCSQYLLMDDSLYGLTGMEGAKYVCTPPLRKPEDSQCLWRALADGVIQTVSTDHCSSTTVQKAPGKDDFTKIPRGMPGIETKGTLFYIYGVDARRIARERMCQLLSENPARLYGMYPEKGVTAPGSDADIVIMRTGVEDTVTVADQVQNVDYTPFEGGKLTARIESVFPRGTQAVKDRQVVVEKAGGFVKCGKYAL